MKLKLKLLILGLLLLQFFAYGQKTVQLSKIWLKDGSFVVGNVEHFYTSGKYFIELTDGTELFIKKKNVERIETPNKFYLVDGRNPKSILIRGWYSNLVYSQFVALKPTAKNEHEYAVSQIGNCINFINGFSAKETFGIGIGVGRHQFPAQLERELVDNSYYTLFVTSFIIDAYTFVPVFMDFRGAFRPPAKLINLNYEGQMGFEIPTRIKVNYRNDFNGDYFTKDRIIRRGAFFSASVGIQLPTYRRFNYDIKVGYLWVLMNVEDKDNGQEAVRRSLSNHGLLFSFGLVF